MVGAHRIGQDTEAGSSLRAMEVPVPIPDTQLIPIQVTKKASNEVFEGIDVSWLDLFLNIFICIHPWILFPYYSSQYKPIIKIAINSFDLMSFSHWMS